MTRAFKDETFFVDADLTQSFKLIRKYLNDVVGCLFLDKVCPPSQTLDKIKRCLNFPVRNLMFFPLSAAA